jgi:uncharacterized membrane protein
MRIPIFAHFGTLTCISRMGALMGCGVGLTIGFIFGSFSIMRCVCANRPYLNAVFPGEPYTEFFIGSHWGLYASVPSLHPRHILRFISPLGLYIGKVQDLEGL